MFTDDGVCVCQAYVVKVERDGQEVQLVQRTFEEFYELHCKLRLVFPSSKLPRYTRTCCKNHRDEKETPV